MRDVGSILEERSRSSGHMRRNSASPVAQSAWKGGGFLERVLIIYGIDGQYHAFRNKCGYMGRRIDPVVGTATVRCCGLSGSTFDYTGNVMSGSAKESLKTFRVRTKNCKVIIWLD